MPQHHLHVTHANTLTPAPLRTPTPPHTLPSRTVSRTVSEADRAYMRQALDLARRALGQTFPNPAVGCVIVKDGKVGWRCVLLNNLCCRPHHA